MKKHIFVYLFSALIVNTALFNNYVMANNIKLGDVNRDNIIDASDASAILSIYSLTSTGNEKEITDNEFYSGDVNGDGSVDASDASIILSYYSFVSTGGKISLSDYLIDLNIKPVITTSTSAISTVPTSTQPIIEEPYNNIEQITYDANAFKYYADCLNWDLLQGNGIYMSYTDASFGGRECYVALAILNNMEINDDVLCDVFSYYSKEELIHGCEYTYSIRAAQMLMGTDVDYSKYVIDEEIGQFLNTMDDKYRNGELYDFFKYYYFYGNLNEKCMNNSAIWVLGSSYDVYALGMSKEAVDGLMMNERIDNLYSLIKGN